MTTEKKKNVVGIPCFRPEYEIIFKNFHSTEFHSLSSTHLAVSLQMETTILSQLSAYYDYINFIFSWHYDYINYLFMALQTYILLFSPRFYFVIFMPLLKKAYHIITKLFLGPENISMHIKMRKIRTSPF